MKKILRNFAFIVLLAGIGIACNRHSVTRIDPNQVTDLSGRWNDTDSRLVAEEMTKQVLGEKWLEDFQRKHNRKPVVIVGIIQNKSHEHIEAETFIKDIQREFIRDGRVRVVQNSELREAIRRERGEQQEFASPETQKKFGRELGADFMMFGTLNSIVDAQGKKKAVFYQTNLELADMETNELVWVGEKKIKKFITN
jgi:uncharacterized protein (TIGR02722 family)